MALPSTFTPITITGATQITTVGVNTAGNLVGFFVDAAGVTHGFERLANGTTATQDKTGTVFNRLLGIND